MYRFKEIRESKGFSQKFVALSLGVKPPSISDWENGKTKPTIENLIALSDLLGVSCDELLGRTVQPLSSASSAFSYVHEETQLIVLYRKLTEQNKSNIRNNIQFLLNQQNEEKDMHSMTTA